MVMSVVIAAAPNKPKPEAIPMAAAIQMLAAFARPFILFGWDMIEPAPMKPTPVIIEAASNNGFDGKSAMPDEVIRAAPRQTIAWVLKPAEP